MLGGYDALFVGGASEASVLEPDSFPFVASCERLLLDCLERSLPVFASCFGFQLAVQALGGTIVRDACDFEMGTIPMRLTAASRNDPLFCNMPDGFKAVSVHRERAADLPPPVCRLLAETDSCPHAFRVHDKPFRATRFHPEVDRRCLVERLTIFQSD